MSTFEYMGRKTCKEENPLLVIGLGGGGANGVLRVKELFAKRFEPAVDCNGKAIDKPEGVSYLVLDSDANTIDMRYNGTRLDPGEFVDLTVTGLPAMLNAPAYLKPYQQDWLDERYQNDFNNGAGSIRQVGRLLFMLHSEMIYGRLKKEIASLLARTSWQYKGNCLSVAVITSVVGGTGSGIFLDMAYLLRRVIKGSFPGIEIDITAYVIMPELVIRGVGAYAAHRRGLETNGFAALKELDYWMGEAGRNHEHIQQYGEGIYFNWQDEAPFDEVILLSGMDQNGSMNQDAYSQALDAAALHLLAQMERNFMQDWPTYGVGCFSDRENRSNTGMLCTALSANRPANHVYSALGVAAVKVPRDEMVDYEASLLLNDVVKLERNKVNPNADEAQQMIETVLPLKGLYNGVKSGAPLPDWESVAMFPSASAAAEFRTVADTYHTARLDMWRKCVVVPAMQRSFFGDTHEPAERGFLRECWERFCGEAQAIITDVNKGPCYLVELLAEDDRGLLSLIENRIREVDGNIIHCEMDLAHYIDTANCYMEKAFRPTMTERVMETVMPRQSPFGLYMDRCLIIYEIARKLEYTRQLREVLVAFRDMVNRYGSILDKCNGYMKELHYELEGAKHSASEPNPMFNLNGVFAHIRDQYRAMNTQNGMTDALLHAMAHAAPTIEQMQTPPGRDKVKDWIKKLIEGFINETFAPLNGCATEDLILLGMGQDASYEDLESVACNRWMPLLRGMAEPKFPGWQNELQEYAVDNDYALLPNCAGSVAGGFTLHGRQQGKAIAVKGSLVQDRIILIRTRSALPLCAYAPLRGMEDAYKASQQNGWRGIHLLGEWRNLPSPVLNEWAEGESRD